MAECVICQHAKIEAINTAIARKIYDGVVSAQYKLPKADVQKHREQCLAATPPVVAMITHHGPVAPAETEVATDESLPLGWPQVPETPLRQARRALSTFEATYTEAKADTWAQGRMREDLRELLARLFAEDEMGL